MARITRRHIFKDGSKPRDYELNGEFDNILSAINGALGVDNFELDAGGRVVISIEGDARTVGGLTADQIIAGDYTDVKHALADIAHSFIYSGGLGTKDPNTANFLNVSACVAYFRNENGILRITTEANSYTTTLVNTVYYLDITEGGALHFSSTRPPDEYMALAEVLTNATGNIETVTDKRRIDIELFADGDGQVSVAAAGFKDARRRQVMGV